MWFQHEKESLYVLNYEVALKLIGQNFFLSEILIIQCCFLVTVDFKSWSSSFIENARLPPKLSELLLTAVLLFSVSVFPNRTASPGMPCHGEDSKLYFYIVFDFFFFSHLCLSSASQELSVSLFILSMSSSHFIISPTTTSETIADCAVNFRNEHKEFGNENHSFSISSQHKYIQRSEALKQIVSSSLSL